MKVITDTERTTFNVEDHSLKSAVEADMGKWPDDVWVHSPTPWGDMYKLYNWDEVTTNVAVSSAKIIGVTSEPVIVATRTLANTSSIAGDFDASITEQVTSTFSNTWSQTDKIDVGQKFTYALKFLGTGVGGETSLTYSHSWGESKTETKQMMVGSSAGVKVRLEPGRSVIAKLTASRGVLSVRVGYDAYLSGQVAVNYDNGYNGHHFWGPYIDSVMNSGKLTNNRTITEDIHIGYYTDAKVTLEDPKTGALLASYGPGAMPGTDDDEGFTLDLREPAEVGAV